MPRRKKKKKLFYLGLKNNGKHSKKEKVEEEISKKNKRKRYAKSHGKRQLANSNKIEEKQKKKEAKERIRKIEKQNKEIRKNKKKETKEELKNNKYTNRKDNDEIFDFDKEIVLGVNDNMAKKINKNNAKAKNKKIKKKVKKKNKRVSLILKCTSLLVIGAGIIIFSMTSPVFNITDIEVQGNIGVQKETIIGLSGVKLGENIFKINVDNVISNIKNNTYIKSVEISRDLPTKLKIIVTERNTKYMLECAGNYMYIDNQGYLLELTQVALDVPIITGFEAKEEELLKIARLGTKDLLKLNDIIKITETSNNYKLYDYINKFDVTNSKDYIIYMDELGKTVYLGDASDLNNKMLHLREILSKTQDKRGSIFINGNLNDGFKPYFREDI